MNKNFFLKRFLLYVIFVSTSFILHAQDHIQFKNYTINDGLSQSSVSCIIQDQLGALWLGTQDGINRFNGKNFEVFSADQGYDISNGYINTSFTDRNGNMWFGTYNGLTKYNPRSVKFSSFQVKSQQRLEIQSIAEDTYGHLWIGTAFGRIFKFDTDSLKFELIDDTIFDSRIIDIRSKDNELIIVSEFEGVLITDFAFRNKKVILPNINNKEDFITNGLIESPEHEIVISTNEGVFYYDKNSNSFHILDHLFSHLRDVNIIDAIYLSPDRLFIASENSGLFQISKDEKDSVVVLNYSADIFQKGSLISNKLSGLFKDNQGVIWITSQRGLSSFNPEFIGFKGVGTSADLSKGLPSQNIWGFAESKNQRYLYIAADHGVSSFDRTTHHYYHYYRSSQENDDHTTLTIEVIDENILLVGCIDGLYELVIDSDDPNQYTFTKLIHAADIQRGFDLIYTIQPYTEEHTYLIGTRAGVMLFNYKERSFHYLFHRPQTENTISPGPCRFVFRKDDNFYTSPSSGGLFQIKFENDELKAFAQHEFSPLSKATSAYFSDVFQANNKEFWFGTMGDGLFKYSIETKKVIRYDKSKGLPNNVIYGVEAVELNPLYIWLSTNKGVVALNTKENLFYTFSEKDGLMSNELNLGASFLSQNGEIYFGGIQGFNYVKPSEAFQINKNIRVYFSGIEVENVPVFPEQDGILSQSIAFTDRITLPYNKRSLKLRFFANDLSNPDRIEYKYVMSGDDEVEEVLGSTNELRFTSIAPGVYELYIYARTTNGNWNKYPARLTIEVERPFWMKWWFYAIFIVVVTLFVIYRVRKSIDKERRQQVRLEMKIAERTRELRKKNEKIQQQKSRLILQTEELEREKEKSERLLNNILPKETASQLKKDGRSAARSFSKVSIMFTDFVGFSKIAEEMSAKDLVSILDRHFRKFDEIIEINDLEKIKTIGDAYMAAGGVPIRNKTNPINTALAAVQIKSYMLEHKNAQIKADLPYWKLRIGINTGPVSAGVIGTKRYAYDVWGNTVNRAQRMEELCEPGKITITQDTFDHIEPYFLCNKIGKVRAKSGIKIMTYEVVSIKPELSVDGKGIEPNESFHKLVNLHHFSKINYYKAERFILSKLKKELSPKLHYHSLEHSIDVTRQAERIAIGEGITDEDLFLLKSAASYHDAGFVEQYEKNEPIGARMAAEILPKFGYTEAHIERIKELIYVTSVPHKPKNNLEEIICDADLDYLGRDDFHEIADRLRMELREHGKIDSDRMWDEMQVKFLSQHRYFTKTSIDTRLAKKLQNLEEIKEKLKTYDYKD
ncbi:adenylate/guanylate cyclase domain-containing protein [Brumimicrobium sp.]|uniref:adenylate/guanylate cyclase domain-containing protein n=1 Tax=Brumimicrobium sp. TaxID=2029867 RepID=UPI003A8EB57A